MFAGNGQGAGVHTQQTLIYVTSGDLIVAVDVVKAIIMTAGNGCGVPDVTAAILHLHFRAYRVFRFIFHDIVAAIVNAIVAIMIII